MNVGRVLVFPQSSEPQLDHGKVRATQIPIHPTAGSSTAGENPPPQNGRSAVIAPQDEVKVQWDRQDQVMIYQFVDQQGGLILQVPNEQLLSLAHAISQELVQGAAPSQERSATTVAVGATRANGR